jgi:hypothetical protein
LRREHPPSFTVWHSSATIVILPTMLLFQFLLLDLILPKRVLITWPIKVDDVAVVLPRK